MLLTFNTLWCTNVDNLTGEDVVVTYAQVGGNVGTPIWEGMHTFTIPANQNPGTDTNNTLPISLAGGWINGAAIGACNNNLANYGTSSSNPACLGAMMKNVFGQGVFSGVWYMSISKSLDGNLLAFVMTGNGNNPSGVYMKCTPSNPTCQKLNSDRIVAN